MEERIFIHLHPNVVAASEASALKTRRFDAIGFSAAFYGRSLHGNGDKRDAFTIFFYLSPKSYS